MTWFTYECVVTRLLTTVVTLWWL